MTSSSIISILLVTVIPVYAAVCDFNEQTLLLDCRARGLTSVPTDELHFNDARRIDLSNNNLQRIENFTFTNVSSLQVLDFAHNKISAIEPRAFHGLAKLKVLNLSVNVLQLSPLYLEPAAFEPLQSLEVFRFQSYLNSTYSWKGIDLTLGTLKSLKTLFLDLPYEFVFGPGFGALRKLSTISTSGGQRESHTSYIVTLTNETFAVFKNIPLKELRLINCGISTLESGTFDALLSLHTLDLSHNKDIGLSTAIQSLHSFEGRYMEEISLTEVNNHSCRYGDHFSLDKKHLEQIGKLCIKFLDMSYNYMTYMDPFPIDMILFMCLETFNMSFHSLHCLPRIDFGNSALKFRLKSVDFSSGYIPARLRGDSITTNVLSYKERDSQCHDTFEPSTVNLVPSLKTVNISGAMFSSCIDNPITVKNGWNLTFLNFAYNNLGYCEQSIVRGIGNLTHLDISGVMCAKIHPNYFSDLLKLTHLSLSNSPHIAKILRSPFYGPPFTFLTHLESIDLSRNQIVDIQAGMFSSKKKLRSINLANNKLQSLPRAISEVSGLQYLDLSSNSFTSFSIDEMKIVDRWTAKIPFKLFLVNNPLQCTCDTVLFIQWLLERQSSADIKGSHECRLSNGSWVDVQHFGNSLTDFKIGCNILLHLTLGGAVLAFFSGILLSYHLIRRKRLKVEYWLHTKLKPPDELFEDRDFDYDVFVGYTDDELAWVGELCRELESEALGNPLKFCVHHRDFAVGGDIRENIIDSIRRSRRILLVISMAFIESAYGSFEIELALLKSRCVGREGMIVCVLMEDIPVRQMTAALKTLWHTITFLKWSHCPEEQIIFWRRLTEGLKSRY